MDEVRVRPEAVFSLDQPNGFNRTELGLLPNHWKIARLGDLAAVKYGKAKPKESGEIPAVGSGGVYGWTFAPLVNFPTLVVGRKGTAGKVWLQESPCWPSDTTFYLEWDTNEVNHRFLYYLLQERPLSGEHAKTTLPSLSKPDLENHLVPLPPLTEQQAIAYVLRTVQKAKEATEQVIASARELKRSLMNHFFNYGPVSVDEAEQVPLKESEIGKIPEHWNLVKIGDVAKVGNGSTPKRTNPAYWVDGTRPWLTSGKVHETIIEHADEFVTELAQEKCHLPVVPGGSIVVAITGQGKTLGNAALVTFDTSVSQHLAYLSFRSPAVHPEFALAFLQRRYEDLRRAGREGGSTKGALTCGFLKSYSLPLPPIDEQQEIARMLGAVDEKIAVEENRKQSLDVLFKTLLHDLMTCKVRVQDLDLSRVEEMV